MLKKIWRFGKKVVSLPPFSNIIVIFYAKTKFYNPIKG